MATQRSLMVVTAFVMAEKLHQMVIMTANTQIWQQLLLIVIPLHFPLTEFP